MRRPFQSIDRRHFVCAALAVALLVFVPVVVLGQIRPVPESSSGGGGTSSGCILEITVSGPNPNPAKAGDTVMASLSATRNGPALNSECAVTSKSCLWTVTSVKYCAKEGDTPMPMPTSLVSFTNVDGVEPRADLIAPGLSAGYWDVTVDASATWSIEKSAGCGDCDCGGCAKAVGDTTIAFAVVAVDRVIVSKSKPEIIGSTTGWVGEAITLEAMPKPMNMAFPPRTLKWEVESKPDGSKFKPGDGAEKTLLVKPDKPGEYKFKATCGTSFAVFTLTVNDLSIVIEKCPNNFLPKGGSEDNTVTIKAKVVVGDVSGRFRFELNNVSTEKGFCLNAPLTPPDNGQDSDDWADLHFRNQGGFQINRVGTMATTTANNLREATVTVSCTDYGAYGQITVTFTRNGATESVMAKEEGSDRTFTVIPLDDDNNQIADFAKQNSGPNGAKAAMDDIDRSPEGAGNTGDRLTRYEEYRGFMVSGKHVRTDIDKKEVFYFDVSGVLPQGDWTKDKLGAPILKLAAGEAADDRLVTGNSETAKGPGQRAIFQEINPNVERRANAYWGYASGGTHGGIPWAADFCYVFTDELKGGLRSGSTLLQAVDGNSTQLVVNIGAVPRPAQFADPGEILVGDERIGYARHAVVGNRLFFKQITRGTGNTVAADHPAGAVVRWLIDPDEMTKVIVAHEAGHNVHLTHDKTDNSIMTQVKGGQTDSYHDFRHMGEKAGSTQEYRVR